MILNRSHIPWALLIAAATLVLSAIYLEVFRPGEIPRYIPVSDSLGHLPYGHRSIGATPLGITYGTGAFAIFIFAALLGARKKVRHWRIGRAETWMRAHIWLSILTIPLVLFHCGFHSGSLMTTGLLILYAVVMLSGFYGLALQQFLPGQMMERLSHEVIYDQIPFLRKRLVQSALDLRADLAPLPVPAAAAGRAGRAGRAGSVRAPAFTTATVTEAATTLAVENRMEEEDARAALYAAIETDVLPYLRTRGRSRLKLGHKQAADNWFRMLRISVPEVYRPNVDEMQRWCEQRRQMDLQLVMHHWLHYWLLVHVPASLLLLIWTAWHAVTGLFYY